MAVLPDQDRSDLWRQYQEEISSAREPIGITKSDLRTAVNALDQWLHDNAATINTAIPQPARSLLTASQKARLLAAIVLKRYARGV